MTRGDRKSSEIKEEKARKEKKAHLQKAPATYYIELYSTSRARAIPGALLTTEDNDSARI